MTDAPPAPGDFRFANTIDLTEDGVGFHVNNLEMTEFLFHARNRFITEVAGIDYMAWIGAGRNFVIRQLTVDFVGEVHEPSILQAGVRVASRRRRSVTFDEAVWVSGTERVVVHARSIYIPVQVEPPAAIEVPADVLARLEAHQGAAIELVG